MFPLSKKDIRQQPDWWLEQFSVDYAANAEAHAEEAAAYSSAVQTILDEMQKRAKKREKAAA